MIKLNGITWTALILLAVGGLNWGLVGIFNFDLVNWLFNDLVNARVIARLVYIVVAICAVYMIVDAAMSSDKFKMTHLHK
jgi:uncharacterized membrane protein YuzA (DUF378 family)